MSEQSSIIEDGAEVAVEEIAEPVMEDDFSEPEDVEREEVRDG